MSSFDLGSARIDLDDLDELKRALSRVSFRALDLTAPLSVFGDEVKAQFEAAFDREETPAGDPWAPLAERTQENYVYPRKRKNAVTSETARKRARRSREVRGADHILQGRRVPGWFRRALRVVAGRHSLMVGEHIGPAAFRAEFGNEETNEPARPFIELTGSMQRRCAEIMKRYLGSRWF